MHSKQNSTIHKNVTYDIFAALKTEAVNASETLVSTLSVTTPKTKTQKFGQ